MNPIAISALWKFIEPFLDTALSKVRGGSAIKDQIRLGVLANEGKGIKFAREWLKADSKEEHWFFKGWRPGMMWTCISVLVLYLIIDPLLGLFFSIRVPPPALGAIPDKVWTIILVSIGVRTIDKTVRYRTEKRAEYPVEKVVTHEAPAGRRKSYDVEQIED